MAGAPAQPPSLGFRLYLLCAPDGIPIAFELAAANLDKRVVAAEMLARVELDGYTVIADKGFAGAEFEQTIAAMSARFLRPDRANEPRRHGSSGAVRQRNRIGVLDVQRPTHPQAAWAAAQSNGSAPASRSGCSRSQPVSFTTNRSATPAGTSPATATDPESTI
jgi:hypothetical protein